MLLEILPAIVALVVVTILTTALVRTHKRALKAEERADHAESEMGKIMKYRGITRRDLDALDSPERWGV